MMRQLTSSMFTVRIYFAVTYVLFTRRSTSATTKPVNLEPHRLRWRKPSSRPMNGRDMRPMALLIPQSFLSWIYFCHLIQIVGGPFCYPVFSEDNLLGNTSSECHDKLTFKIFFDTLYILFYPPAPLENDRNLLELVIIQD